MLSIYGVSRVAIQKGVFIMKTAKILARRASNVVSRNTPLVPATRKGFGLLPFALLGMLMYSMSFAQFTGTELDASEAVVTGLLAAGAVAVIAFAIYGIGKRASNKV